MTQITRIKTEERDQRTKDRDQHAACPMFSNLCPCLICVISVICGSSLFSLITYQSAVEGLLPGPTYPPTRRAHAGADGD